MSTGESRVKSFRVQFAKARELAARNGVKLMQINANKYVMKSESYGYVMIPASCYLTQFKGETRFVNIEDFNLLNIVYRILREWQCEYLG